MKNNWKNREGVVFSTNENYEYQTSAEEEPETLSPENQCLRVKTDKKNRNGKTVSLITGFIGTSDDIEELAKKLKTYCGTGGNAKNGEILIQGDFVEKIKAYLIKNGYTKTK